MKSISSSEDEQCPFKFNFDPVTFSVGDTVSYRVSDQFGDMPFVGTILEVSETYIFISPNDPEDPSRRMRATRTSRPEVSIHEALS
ncbi:hypothetical protein [Pseudomonas sp. BF-R-19]|uniref:hypothetical protein n=1 Tax=Pseudomonas sp. BF-R-19 TaxID=2832397 RepID=UPI001CBF25D9|nr:hypothetical protein [Pseudomonas sp. BF-R-19]